MRSKTRTAIALLLAAIVPAASAVASGVERHVLSNGMPVLVERLPDSRVVSVGIIVDAGTKRDPRGLEGLAWITAEALGHGSTQLDGDGMSELMESEAVEVRLGAVRDMAYAGARTGASGFEAAVGILRAMLVEPALTEESILSEVERARKTVADQEKVSFDHTYSRLLALLLGDHPYQHSVGTRRGLEALTRKAVTEFHARHYTADNSVVAIVGDVRDGFVDILEEQFADYPRGSKPLPPIPGPPTARGEKRTFHMEAETGRAQIGFVAPAAGEPDNAAVSVIESILGIGSRSRFKEAFGGQDCDICGAFYHPMLNAGWFVAHASGDDPIGALARIQSEIERLKTEPVPEEELTAAKSRLVGIMSLRSELGLDRAFLLAWSELAGLGPAYHDELKARVRRVDADDVMRAARKHLTKGAAVIMLPGRPRGTGV